MEAEKSVDVPPREHRLHWWKEALIVAVFYIIYSWIRNQFGSNTIAADLTAKAPVVTLAEYDKLTEKDVKGFAAGNQRPISSVVRTISGDQ